MGDDDRLCDKEDVKLVNVDRSSAVGGVGAWIGRASRCAEVETEWDNWRLPVSVGGGEALLGKREGVARECRCGRGVSVVRSATMRLLAGDRGPETWVLVDFWRSVTFVRGLIICRIRPLTPFSMFMLGQYDLVVEFHRKSVFERERRCHTA